MKAPLKISRDELSKARKAGFKRKKPKKPRSKTYASVESYLSRYNDWVRDAKAKAKEYEQLQKAKRMLNGI